MSLHSIHHGAGSGGEEVRGFGQGGGCCFPTCRLCTTDGCVGGGRSSRCARIPGRMGAKGEIFSPSTA